MPIKTITDASFQTDVVEADRPVLVELWAEWCGPSRIIGPTLADLADEFSDRLTIGRLNVDDNPRVRTEYGVRGIPTMVFFKGGNVVTTKTGVVPQNAIRAWLKALVG